MRCNLAIVAVGALGVAVGIISAADAQQWWADQTLHEPTVPSVANDDWCANDIDRFILAKLESEGLSLSEEADAFTLSRRAHFDLVF